MFLGQLAFKLRTVIEARVLLAECMVIMWQSPRPIRILAYHALSATGQAVLPTSWSPSHTVSVESFRRQLHFLKDHDWQTVLPKDLGALQESQSNKHVILTFDDGHQSDATAAELMAAYGYRAIFYVPLDHFNRAWFLTRVEIRNLSARGFAIGSHGRRHYPLTELRDPELWEELRESREVLEDLIAKPVQDLALPFGRYDQRVVAIANAVGFQRIVTSDIGLARRGCSGVFPRLPVTARTTDQGFERLLSVGPTRARSLRYSMALARRWRYWRGA